MVKLNHLAVAVRDHRAARDWYRSVAGLKVEFELPERGVVALQDDGDFTLILHETPAEVSATACIVYFEVDDVAATHRELAARGVPFVHPPRKEPWGFGAELLDPDGHRVRLWDQTSMQAEGE